MTGEEQESNTGMCEWRIPFFGKSLSMRELTRLSSTPIPKAVIAGLVVILGICAYGLVLLHWDKQAFLVWIREDGFVEWLTVAELVIMSVFSFSMSRAFSRSGQRTAAERVWLFMGFLFLFGALEEISWGQRILGIESPQWFLKHNKQGETNIHNLLIYGVNINKLVFGKILTILIALYLLPVPLLYRFNERWKNLMNRWGIPIAQNYQILLFIIVIVIIQLHLGLAKKAGELLELCSCFLFLLILVHPSNGEVFPLKVLGPQRSRRSRGEEKGPES
jgi:hypothetical protein